MDSLTHVDFLRIFDYLNKRFIFKDGEIMRVNIYGGPGIGKSSIAAYVFSELKARRVNVELISEYIKSWAWEEKIPKSFDQHYVFAKQLHSEDKILRHDTHIVTDSPLWMSIGYMKRNKSSFVEECAAICEKFDVVYPHSVNILLKRDFDYDVKGRYENLDQAIEMDEMIKEILETYVGGYYKEFSPKSKRCILDYVISELDKEAR